MTEKDIEMRLAEMEFLDAFNMLRKFEGLPPLDAVPEPPYCSFCGRSKSEAGALVEGLDAYICAACAGKARKLLLGATL